MHVTNCMRFKAYCRTLQYDFLPKRQPKFLIASSASVRVCALTLVDEIPCYRNYRYYYYYYFMCHCSNTWVERTPKKHQHRKLTPKKKILPPLLSAWESNSQPFDHESGALPTSYPGSLLKHNSETANKKWTMNR